MTRIACRFVASLFVAALIAGSLMPGDVNASNIVLDEDFTSAGGYVTGSLQFQQPNGAGNGIWLGQRNGNTGNPSVDSAGDGVLNVISNTPPTGDAFLRNMWNIGATGARAGGGSTTNEAGTGFNEGDQIAIDFEYQVTLPGNGNHSLFVAGVTDCFVSCGFNAAPRAGISASFNSFEAGTIKVFTNLSRFGSSAGDNPFALFIDPASIGLNNGFDGGMVDFDSDRLAFSYTAELTDGGTNTWTATSLTVTNVDTGAVVADAMIDNPNAVESFVWGAGGVAAHPTAPGSEMYFASRWTDITAPGGAASFDSVRFEYTAVPEPASTGLLFGLAASLLPVASRRR